MREKDNLGKQPHVCALLKDLPNFDVPFQKCRNIVFNDMMPLSFPYDPEYTNFVFSIPRRGELGKRGHLDLGDWVITGGRKTKSKANRLFFK